MSDSFLHGVEVLEIDSGAAPIRAVATSVIGLVGTAPHADPTLFPLDTPVLVASQTLAAALLANLPADAEPSDDRGTLPTALAAVFDQARPPVVVVRVDDEETEAAQLAEVAGSSVTNQGVYALLTAQQMVGVQPRILAAPGHTHQVPMAGEPAAAVANPVAVALKAVAARLRAVAVIDGPNDTLAAATAKLTREGGDRVYMVDGHAKALSLGGEIVTAPASGFVAGRIARTDAENGFWHSPSNKPLNGVLGQGRHVSFSLSDPAAESNLLNAAGVATIVSIDGGFVLWGNRTGPDDFLSVRRTADVIHDAIERSHLWALDRPQSGQLLQDVLGNVEAYLRELKARGAILGGKAWLDPELNTEATLKAGRAYVNFDFLPPPPLERLTFRAHREDSYFTGLVELAA